MVINGCYDRGYLPGYCGYCTLHLVGLSPQAAIRATQLCGLGGLGNMLANLHWDNIQLIEAQIKYYVCFYFFNQAIKFLLTKDILMPFWQIEHVK